MDADDPSSQPYYDVVVILGHSNVFNFGSLNISDILEAVLHPRPPSFIVFLGCCGGNPRYGPLKKLSLLPEWQNTIFSYFQRRIYKDELCNTIPVLAIQYYLHLETHYTEINKPLPEKFLLVYSIRCAYLDSRYRYKGDSARFLNPKYELSPAQEFLEVVKKSTGGNAIPLSCWQLAMYHNFILEQHGEKTMRNFISIVPYVSRQNAIANIDEICKAALNCQKLYKIIELAHELQSLEVTEETLDLLRNNKWNEVDHLQFFVAMLQGYWGKNNYDSLLEYATYHLMMVMKLLAFAEHPDKKILHKYQLCCVGYCSFSPDSYIIAGEDIKEFYLWRGEVPFEITCAINYRKIISPGELCYFSMSTAQQQKLNLESNLKAFTDSHQHKMKHYINGTFECVITEKGYQVVSNDHITKLPCLVQLSVLPTNEEELPWVDVSVLCRKDYVRFVKLYNSKEGHIDMHSWLKDDCDTCNKIQATGKRMRNAVTCPYKYEYKDLSMALNALQDYFFPLPDARKLAKEKRLCYFYRVKKFVNADIPESGYMKCFPDDMCYCEMTVIHRPDTLSKVDVKDPLMTHHEKCWGMVSRCRFIFACTVTVDKKTVQGKLYFTNSHYGDDKIPKEAMLKKLCFQMFEMFIKDMKKNTK